MATIFNFCTTSKYFSYDTKLFYTLGAQLKFVCMQCRVVLTSETERSGHRALKKNLLSLNCACSFCCHNGRNQLTEHIFQYRSCDHLFDQKFYADFKSYQNYRSKNGVLKVILRFQTTCLQRNFHILKKARIVLLLKSLQTIFKCCHEEDIGLSFFKLSITLCCFFFEIVSVVLFVL